jgi:ADP-heptose:LPS heptosyltransferase
MWACRKICRGPIEDLESNLVLSVLCGGLEERDLCSQMIHLSGKEALNLAGKTSLPELVEVIRRSKFLIGNETSAIHIAAPWQHHRSVF